MKVAPLYHALKNEEWVDVHIVHTGQHYDANMSDVFFRDLGLPEPTFHLEVGSGTHAEQTGGVMIAYEMLTMRETEKGIVYRFDYYDKKKNFENPPSAFFILQSLEGDKALFTSKREPEWDLFLEKSAEGNLYGGQRNDTTGEVYVGYDAEKVSD